MKFLENTKLIINLSIILTTLAVVYFLLATINLQKDDREKFDSCLSDSMKSYVKEWDFQCKQNKQSDCTTLPGLTALRINSDWKENKLNCAKLYK